MGETRAFKWREEWSRLAVDTEVLASFLSVLGWNQSAGKHSDSLSRLTSPSSPTILFSGSFCILAREGTGVWDGLLTTFSCHIAVIGSGGDECVSSSRSSGKWASWLRFRSPKLHKLKTNWLIVLVHLYFARQNNTVVFIRGNLGNSQTFGFN